jgi:hypothetical protein
MKSDLAYIRHMIDSIKKIESYSSVGKEEFFNCITLAGCYYKKSRNTWRGI